MKKILILFVILICSLAFAEDVQQLNNPIAVVLKVKGEFELLRADALTEFKTGTMLYSDDKIISKSSALALIKFVDNSGLIRVFPNSEIILNIDFTGKAMNKNIEVKSGSLFSRVNKTIVGKYDVSTKSAVASVRGTEFLVDLLEDGDTRVIGFSGKVEVKNVKSGETKLVTKGNTVFAGVDGELRRFETTETFPELKDLLQHVEKAKTMKIELKDSNGDIKTIIMEY